MPATKTTPTTRREQPARAAPIAAAKVIDHIGPPRDPYRVTIIQLARRAETYEIRWRENAYQVDGTVARERRTLPGGRRKSDAYAVAEKVHRSLLGTNGFQGAPPRPKGAPKDPAPPKTFRQVADLWLAQHPSNATKPGTVEGYETLMRTSIWPKLTYTETHGRQTITRGVELGSMVADDLREADINRWLIAVSQKPDARRKDAAVAISSSTVNSCLTVLNACLNWGVAHGYLASNPAATVEVTVHGRRVPEHFHTPEEFWAALEHIDALNDAFLHNFLVALGYLGLRIRELAALQWNDIDWARHRVTLSHNFDGRHRPSTLKTEDSEDWVPLHPEAEAALQDQRGKAGAHVAGTALVFRGPRGGIITPNLVNTALARGCEATNLGRKVTAHGLRHSFANWLKNAGVHTADIQKVLRHTDLRTTTGYLHTTDLEKINAVSKLPTRKRS